MKYSAKEVIHYVREALGYNFLQGVFIAEDAIFDYDTAPEERKILTSIEPEVNCIDYLGSHWDSGIKICSGMTKLVIIPPNRNYVIKIPFTGFYSSDCDEDGYESNYQLVGEAKHDVCSDENCFYEQASEELQQVLTPNIFVANVDGISVYIQEKYSTTYGEYEYCSDLKYEKTISPAKKKIIDYITYEQYAVGKSFVGALVDTFGIAKAARVVFEISNIDDLHCGNYGFAKDGRCMIFDYAGYNESLYEYFD